MKSVARLTLEYYWQKTWTYKWKFLGIMLAISSGIFFLGIAIPFMYKELIDLLITSSETPKSEIFTTAITYLMYIAIIYIGGNIAWRCAEFVNNRFQPQVMRDIENDCFKKLETHSYNFFANRFSGALVTQTNRMWRAFERISDVLFWDLTTTFVRLGFSIAVLWYFAPTLGITLFIWSIIYIAVVAIMYRYRYPYDIKNASADSKVTANLADGITNMLNIKMFAKGLFEIKRFWNSSQERYKIRRKAWDIGAYMSIVQGILMTIVEILLIYMAIVLWRDGSITIGTIVLMFSYLGVIMHGLWHLGRVLQSVYESLADAEEMTEILKLEAEIKDAKEPEKCKIKKGQIDINKMTFAYNKVPVYKNFNLNIPAGQSVGLVGESGSGKSTLIKLLLRFADLTGGEILIDGQNIAKIKQNDLRKNISYVPQDPVMFHRTIKENIAYAKPNATMKEIIDVAKKAHVHEFVSALPKRYDTLVGERGIKLSGGERQRIAIARAMLKQAPVLILDEATSSLDSKSEKLIQDALAKLVKGKTTIAIAHRLSTIQQMDRILVLHKGKVVEDGPHKELVKKKGKYAELWSHQAGGFLLDE